MATASRSRHVTVVVVAVVGAAFAVGSLGDSKAPVLVGSRLSTDVIDLHRVNWKTAQLPGRVCGLRHPVRLRAGKARISARLEVNAGWHAVVYGDLDRDGRDEAALSVACTNGGGTADSVLSYSVAMYRAGRNSPAPIGILRPVHQPAHELPTLLEVAIGRGRVIGQEAFYGPKDGTCCPSGRARTIWTYSRGVFRVATTRITKKPG